MQKNKNAPSEMISPRYVHNSWLWYTEWVLQKKNWLLKNLSSFSFIYYWQDGPLVGDQINEENPEWNMVCFATSFLSFLLAKATGRPRKVVTNFKQEIFYYTQIYQFLTFSFLDSIIWVQGRLEIIGEKGF